MGSIIMNLRHFQSLRILLLILVTISVLPPLGVMLYSGFEARNKAINDAEKETMRLVQNMAAIQERVTASTHLLLSSLTLVPEVKNQNLPACNELFKHIIELNPGYVNVIMANRQGDVIASAVPHPPANLSDRKHFKDACRSRGFSTGEYIISRTTAEPAFPFSYPVLDPQGNIQAVLIAALGLNQFGHIFSQELLPKESFFGICDHAGLRLFRIPLISPDFELGKPIASQVWHFVQNGGISNSMLQDGSDNIRRIIAFNRLNTDTDSPPYMYMFIGIPEKALYREANAAMVRNICFIGISWVLALVLAWIIGKFILLHKVKLLTEAAERFGTGDFLSPTGLDHNSGELGLVASALDHMAAERHQAEQEKEKLHGQLIQAQKLESVGRLAGGVAHDFNNMLMIIRGHAELAVYGIPPDHPGQQHLVQVINAAERSSGLTRQLLAFARKQTIAPKVLNLNEVIAGTLKMLQRLIGENISISWVPGMDLWPVKVDPTQIDQVLANLMVNARDAISELGRVTIETTNRVIDDACCADHFECIPGQYVMLSVSDDGCGMDKETQNHLFEPFFTTKVVGRGTGLGLSTVYGIVKQNSGFVSVHSELGKGTSFNIYLPRYVGVICETEAADQAGLPKGQGETILLVEDDATILEMGKAMLQYLGYAVIAANAPVDALKIVVELPSPIHLLITDVVMPEMNGRDLADKIKALQPTVKCLFMSGYTADIIGNQGVLDEGVNFIEKPFSIKTLALKILSILHC